MPNPTAYQRFIDALRDRGSTVKDTGDSKAQAQCPAHDDGTASLSVGPRRDGTGIVVHCHAGCDTTTVMQALTLTVGDLFDAPTGRVVWSPRRDYQYPGGRVVHRKPGKVFPQSGNKDDKSLYVAGDITAAETVFVCEGEKDCEAVELVGGTAACSAMGAGKAHLFDWSPLAGKTVVVVADKDEPGRQHAARVAELLDGIAASVRIVEAKIGKDAADHIAAGLSLDEFVPVGQEDRGQEDLLQGGDQEADGAELLDDVAAWYRRFIAVTDPDDIDLLTLWTVSTHMACELYTTARLLIDSTMPGSGKTTLLEHLYRLCWRAVQAASLSSPALLVRLLQDGVRTLLIDEVDRSLNLNKPGVEDLIAIINSGYKRGATRPVLVPAKGGNWEVREMPTFCPVGMAGNSPHLPDDTKSRQLRVLLMPDLDGTVEDSDWELIEGEAEALHDRIAAFADLHRESVARGVELPAGCVGRAKEKWRPLKRVAVAAGGDWPARADRLIQRGLAEEQHERDDGLRALPPGMVLLTDLFAVLGDVPDSEFVATKEIVSKLIVHNPEYWGMSSNYGKALTDTRFGRLVTQASKVTSQRPGGRGPRGYQKAQFNAVWHRLGISREQPGAPRSEPGAPGYLGAPGADLRQVNRDSQVHQVETGVQLNLVPGAPTDRTPGMTERVQQILAKANGFGSQPPCFHCDRPVTDRRKDLRGRFAHAECEGGAA